MNIYLASDHTGFAIKEKVKKFLQEQNYTVEDCGAYTLDPQDDYPQFMHRAAESVAKDPHNNRGIIFGGSGQGEAMVANKVKGIRCALFYAPAVPVQAINNEGTQSEDPLAIVQLTREHNSANVLSLGVRFIPEEMIYKVISLWLQTPDPTNERHLRRIAQMSDFEK